jgi:hypothetical protein
MQITLEQVEILKEKAGLGYKEALELLEKTGGDLLKALALLEEDGKIAFAADDHEEKLWRKAFKKGREMKIKINRPGGTLFRVPLVLGVIGAVAFPRLASWSMLALLLARCSLEIEFH